MEPTSPGRGWRGRPRAVWLLMALLGVLGVSGLAGGAQFLVEPSGALVGLSPAALAGSPFADYRFPGLVLFTLLGVVPLVVLYGLSDAAPWAWPGAVLVGIALAVWVVVEGLVIGFGERLQYPHLAQAVAIVALAALPSVRAYCGVRQRLDGWFSS